MPGIHGAWHVDGRPVDRLGMARMGATLAHRGSDVPSLFVMPETPIRTSRPLVAFGGRLDNRDDLIAILRARHEVAVNTSDSALVSAAYESFGVDVAARLRGDFALAVFDPLARHLLLARDAMGTVPLYYDYLSGSIAFASQIKALLAFRAMGARPNDDALAGLLRLRFHQQDDDGSTLFQGIHAVPPAHIVIGDSTGMKVHRYWDFQPKSSRGRRSFDDCAQEFREHFQRSVARRMRNAQAVAVSVSGGLDSSSIYCVGHELSRSSAVPVSLVGLTYSTRDGSSTDESAFVCEIERRCSAAIRYVESPPPGMLHRARELIRHVEAPMLDGQWNRTAALLTAAHDQGARVMLTGHWGDQVLFDQGYLIDLLYRGSCLTVHRHLQEFLRWNSDCNGHEFRAQLVRDITRHVVPAWLGKTLRAGWRRWVRPSGDSASWFSKRFLGQPVRDTFRRDLSRTGSTIWAQSLYREVRSRYHGLCLEWNNKVAAVHGLDMAFPFLDRDLVEFLMEVPGEIAASGGVPKALLRRGLSGTVPEAILHRRWKSDFTHVVNAAASRDFEDCCALLTPEALVVQCGYVDANKMHQGLRGIAASLNGSNSNTGSWHLGRIVALELWLQECAGVSPTRQEREDRWPNNQMRATASV